MEAKKFISNYDEACAKLKRSTELPDVSKWSSKMQVHLIALHKLEILLEVNNDDGWEADLGDIDQDKWYPVFRIHKDGKSPGGFRLSFVGSGNDCVRSDVGARLACCSQALADFMGENCTDLYKDLHS